MRLPLLLVAVTLHAQMIMGVGHRAPNPTAPLLGGQAFVASASGYSPYGVYDTTKYTSTSLNVQLHDTLIVWGALSFSACGTETLTPHDSTNTYTLLVSENTGTSCMRMWEVKDAVANTTLSVGMDTTGGNGLTVAVIQLRGMSNSASPEATFGGVSVGSTTTLTSSAFTTTMSTAAVMFVISSNVLWVNVAGSCGGSTATAATGASAYTFGAEYNIMTTHAGTTCTISSSGSAAGLTAIGGAFR